MSFQDFAQRYIDDEDPFEDDPRLDRLMALQEVEPRVTPRHPDWIATVYFDPDKFPIEATLERIQLHYAETDPKRRYNLEMLSSERLMRSSIVKYPLAEEVFRRRGFVSDSEVIGFRRGDNSTETTYLAHNRATVHFQLALIDAYLGPPNTSAAGKERRKIALSQHIGQQGKAPVPLIERDGVFLPCQEFSQKEYVHLAYSAAVSPSLKNGRKDYYGRIIALQREATDAEEKLKRLYRMVEDGIAEMDDILRERVGSLRLDRERAQAALDRVRAQMLPTQAIPLEIVEQFGREMRENIRSGDVPFRKAYLRCVIDRVEVDDASIRIVGDTATLEQAIAGHAGAMADASAGAFGVRRSVRKWRTRQDSNL